MKINLNKLVTLGACIDGLNYILVNKLQDMEFKKDSEVIVETQDEFDFVNWLCDNDKDVIIKSLTFGNQKIEYNEQGLQTKVTYPSGRFESWEYNEQGELIKVGKSSKINNVNFTLKIK